MQTVRIGNGAGFWGDNLAAPRRLAEGAALDYLTLEYLAELTLSILAHLKSKDPQQGYVTDFPTVLADLTGPLQSSGLTVITNAGGMNPVACARAAARVLVEQHLGHLRVAAVAGDDILARLSELTSAGEEFRHLETGRPFADIANRVASANVYLGAQGICDALDQGARIVITGRVADASLTVAPARHAFRWGTDDLDRLAAATVAGHLIECGAQVTGGMFSAAASDLNLADVGYPVAEIDEAGGVVITKPPGTGGTVTVATVAEQLVYEIGDPAHYLTPDLDADFSQVRLKSVDADRVEVSGARGAPAPPTLKVSMSYRDGYMAAGTLVIYGPNAAARAEECARWVLARVRAAGFELQRVHVECLGTGAAVPGLKGVSAPPDGGNATEVVLRIAARDPSRTALERFLREFTPLVASGPPGVTGYTGPRPQPYPVFAFWPTLVGREKVEPTVDVRSAQDWLGTGT